MHASPRANMAGANAFGTKWLKALYRGYTDASFSRYSEQPPWQGTQGPTIRSEVGDLIEIMFVNKMTTNYATMHSMGLEYSKHSEGADYPNSTIPGASNQLSQTNAVPPIQVGVEPSGCVVYKWMVQDAAGPDASEPARTHSYHSYVSLEQDTNAGLIGPSIVYASGQMASVMAEYREFPLLYMIYTETQSFLSGANGAALHGSSSAQPNSGNQDPPSGQPSSWENNNTTSTPLPSGNYSIYHPQLTNLASANQFSAPSFHTMNGYIFANNPIFDMCLNEKVIWYVNAYGSASHVFHMHGNGFKYHGVDEFAISVNDGVGKTLVMDAWGQGLWQVICHVGNHQAKGMLLNYRVYGAGECPLPSLGS
jgi:FtsP/CotA-like multicopper oxidase with cupredoxin domain